MNRPSHQSKSSRYGLAKIVAMTIFVGCLVSPPACASEPLILTMHSIGPVRIGEPIETAYAKLRKLGDAKPPPATLEPSCDYYEAMEGLSFMVERGRIVRIEIVGDFKPGARTPSGIRVGDPIAKLKRTFKGRISDEPQFYDGPEARTLKTLSQDKKFAMRFDVYDDLVAVIYASDESRIDYAEGCS